MPEARRSGEQVYRGIPVSAGVARGRVFILGRTGDIAPRRTIEPHEVAPELERLQAALVMVRRQIQEVQKRVEAAMSAKDAGIFEAHLLVLEDRVLLDEVTKLIADKRLNAEAAFSDVASRYIQSLEAIEDEYLRERVADLRDVSSRVLRALQGRAGEDEFSRMTEPCLILAHDLAPSITATLDRKLVLGFATDVGSPTSHTAILARSLRLPAVVGLKDAVEKIEDGSYVLIDGFNGVLIVNPTDQTLFEYGQIVRKQVDLEEKLRDVRDKPAVTLDGQSIVLSANIEGAGDVPLVRECGADGVGLFRTEYLFLNRRTPPGEEEQFAEYRRVAEALNPQPVIIRTLDLGGDKFMSHLELPAEMNPFLGWRAIRFCLQEKAVFRAQIRAILRASAFGNVRMMYPMISGLSELLQANALVEEYKAELQREGVPFNTALEIGAMIEIPSAALSADSLARHVKFFSIGTNDLIQYSLAVDRLNERIAHLYEPTHPAILRLIRMTVEAAHRAGIWCGVCGEMAGDPVLAPLLIGLGVDELSAAGPLVPEVKFLLRRLKLSEARALAEETLRLDTPAEILARCRQLAMNTAPSLFESRATTAGPEKA